MSRLILALFIFGAVALVPDAGDSAGSDGVFGPSTACASVMNDADCGLGIFFPCDECELSPFDFCSHTQAIIPVEGYRIKN